jgi:hypothetical protein
MPEQKIGKSTPSVDQSSTELTEAYIRVRAYQLFEQRGRQDGHAVEDWLQAEEEILGKKQPQNVTGDFAPEIKIGSAA